jgi:hypothetical protein
VEGLRPSEKKSETQKESILKKLILTSLAIVIALFVTGTAFAAEATASATIMSAIGISKTIDMSFGNVIAPTADKTVILSTAGVRSGTATFGPGGGAAASFDVTGDANATFSITLPGDSDVTIVDGTNNMTVTLFNSAAAAGTQGTLSGTGTQTLLVGAQLNVAANQVPGNYSGTFNVTVAYN